MVCDLDQTKAWQYGYGLAYLKSIEEWYSDYNRYAFSPFSQYKKNSIAKDLNDKKLIINLDTVDNTGAIVSSAVVQTVKVSTPIYMYQDVKIAQKQPTDVAITKLKGKNGHYIGALLDSYKTKNTWVYIWIEDLYIQQIMSEHKFKFVGSKITSFGEIYGVYYRDSCNTLAERNPYRIALDPIEYVSSKLIGDIRPSIIENIESKLNELCVNF